MRILVVGLLLLPVLAGCLEDEPEEETGGEPMPTSPPPVDATNLTWPTGQGARDYIESYVMTHPFRYWGLPDNQFMEAARDDLAALLEGFGQDVTRQAYDGGENILAIQPGTTNPDQWVVLSAHYDTVAGTGLAVYGAWDDGAGTALLLEMAEKLVDWEFPFTIVYAFFDGEEKGLVGSREFVKLYDPSEQDEIDLVMNLNTDPPGLNWPCGQQPQGDFPVKIIHQMARVQSGDFPRFELLWDAVEHGLNATTVPNEVRDYSDGIPIATVQGQGVTGSSDHGSFGAVGVANVFLGGTPTTYATGSPSEGGTAALTYPLHTPIDTLQAMEARCITGTLAGGLDTIVKTMTHALLYLAETEIPERAAIE